MFLFPHDAECRKADPEIFFLPGDDYGAPAARAQVAEAKAYCAVCPVARKCLDWALETGQDEGIWGGTTPPERRSMKRQLLPLSA